jgi:hypothetical protein
VACRGKRTALADLRCDAGNLLVTAAEDVQRQVAVAIIGAMEEPPFLMAVQRSSVASRSRMISRSGALCAPGKA